MNGLMLASSRFSVSETIDRMVALLEAEGWHLFARIDHARHAREKGLALRPTELILFGNPAIGTGLMQENQQAAIDLPMKVLAWEDVDGQVKIAHNRVDWLKQRHGLTDAAALRAIDAILNKLRDAVCAAP